MTEHVATNETILVVGGGISGMTAALEAAETGKNVVLVEKNPALGGRTSQLYRYFPKLCHPTCGLEINLRRLKNNPRVRVLTLAEVTGIEGSTGRADVVFNNGTQILHTQALYGLSVKANPGSVKAGKASAVTFTVTDAGDPVKGAKVKAKGKTCKTDKKGKCTLHFPGLPAGGFDVLATAKHYADGAVRVKVKH